MSLREHGSPRLDEYQPILAARNYPFVRFYLGHYYTMFPFGASILAMPFVAILRPVGTLIEARPELKQRLERYVNEHYGCRPMTAEPVIRLQSLTELLVATVIVAATTVLIFQVACVWLPTWRSAMVAGIFAFGTSAWSAASRSLWQHGPAMLMLSAALLVLLRGRHRRSFFLAGALLSFGYVCRPTSALALGVLSVWALWRDWRMALWYAGGVTLVLIPFFVLNSVWYGNVLPPYYWSERLGSSPYFWTALTGDLISPSRGLLIFSPVVAFSAYGVWRRWRLRQFGDLDVALLSIAILHWLTIASFVHWWGGHSYGPRLFSDVLPVFAYFLVPVLRPSEPARETVPRPLMMWGFAAATAFSVFVHAQGALNPATVRWNMLPKNVDLEPSRLWDWSEPQWLAGLD